MDSDLPLWCGLLRILLKRLPLTQFWHILTPILFVLPQCLENGSGSNTVSTDLALQPMSGTVRRLSCAILHAFQSYARDAETCFRPIFVVLSYIGSTCPWDCREIWIECCCLCVGKMLLFLVARCLRCLVSSACICTCRVLAAPTCDFEQRKCFS